MATVQFRYYNKNDMIEKKDDDISRVGVECCINELDTYLPKVSGTWAATSRLGERERLGLVQEQHTRPLCPSLPLSFPPPSSLICHTPQPPTIPHSHSLLSLTQLIQIAATPTHPQLSDILFPEPQSPASHKLRLPSSRGLTRAPITSNTKYLL